MLSVDSPFQPYDTTNALMFNAGMAYRDDAWPMVETPSTFCADDTSDSSDSYADAIGSMEEDSPAMGYNISLDAGHTQKDSHWTPTEMRNMDYASRADGPNSIYERSREIMDSPTFLGHPDALNGVEAHMDNYGHVRFLRNGHNLTLIALGDMSTQAHGMALSAHGDKEDLYDEIHENERIKHRFVLRCPRMATPRLWLAWQAQLEALDKLEAMAAKLDRTFEQTHGPRARCTPFVRVDTALAEDDELGTVSLLPMLSDAQLYLPRDTSLDGERTGNSTESEKTAPGPTLDDARKQMQFPVRVGQVYHANVLPDHSGYRFRSHQNATIIQRPYETTEGEPVCPWDLSDVFRPNTFSMALLNFYGWYVETSPNEYIQRYCQMQVKSLRALAKSPEPAENITGYAESDYYKAMEDFHGFVV